MRSHAGNRSTDRHPCRQCPKELNSKSKEAGSPPKLDAQRSLKSSCSPRAAAPATRQRAPLLSRRSGADRSSPRPQRSAQSNERATHAAQFRERMMGSCGVVD